MAQGGLGLFLRKKNGFDRRVSFLLGRVPHTHLTSRKSAKQTGIRRSSIRRMVKKRNLKQFKRLKTSQMSEGTRNKKETRVGSLIERFESTIHMIEKTV